MAFTTILCSSRLDFKAFGLFGLLALAWECAVVSAQQTNVKATVPKAARGDVHHDYYQQQQQTLPQLFTSQVQFGQQEAGNQADCPGADGHSYYTPDGVFYAIQCFRHHWTNVIKKTTASSLQECINICNEQPTCQSVVYHLIDDSECALLSGTGESTVDSERCSNHHYAYQIDPPTQPAKDELLIACSVTCPTGNGQSYVTSFGETFRINCGKRHATPPLTQDTRASLKECMEACSALIPCASVDYHESSGTCYYTTHHGEPTVVTPGFSSAFSLGCTGGCPGDPNVKPPKPPAPPTPPAPPAPAPTVPNLTCGNQGLEFAAWFNGLGSTGTKKTDSDPLYDSFKPGRCKSIKPLATGTTKVVGFSQTDNIYGYKPSKPDYVIVIHRGYLFIPQTGVYTFMAPIPDDFLAIWVGPQPLSGYDRESANIIAIVGNPKTGKPSPYKATFNQGDQVPLWITYANGGGPGNFKFSITAPDGTTIVSEDFTKESPFLLQYSCDNESAPKFGPWAPNALKAWFRGDASTNPEAVPRRGL